MEARGADQHTCEQLSQNCGELKAHQNLGQRSRCHEDQHESTNPNQGARHLEIVG